MLVGGEPLHRGGGRGAGVGDGHGRALLGRRHADPEDDEGDDGDDRRHRHARAHSANLVTGVAAEQGRRTSRLRSSPMAASAARRREMRLTMRGAGGRSPLLSWHRPAGVPSATSRRLPAVDLPDVRVGTRRATWRWRPPSGSTPTGACPPARPRRDRRHRRGDAGGDDGRPYAVRAGSPRRPGSAPRSPAGWLETIASSPSSSARETHDAVAWFDGDRDPSASVTHARCEVAP